MAHINVFSEAHVSPDKNTHLITQVFWKKKNLVELHNIRGSGGRYASVGVWDEVPQKLKQFCFFRC